MVGVPDVHEGRTGFLRGEGQVEDFMDHYAAITGPEKVLGVYALVVLGVSLGIGITAEEIATIRSLLIEEVK